jgi:catechol 2,3-dioxygenase-like lactoylglutathione lyase family enzyme
MPKDSTIRYAHTSLVADDWRRMVKFYSEVFGCVPIGDARDRKGPELDALTCVKNNHVEGRHLRLPGHGEHGPTLEIFQFKQNDAAPPPSVMRRGLSHLAFVVPDIEAKRREVHVWGGKDYGQLVTLDIPGDGKLSVLYVCDPEGNVIELQKWG